MPRVQINAPQITLLVRFIFELFEYAASFSPSVTPPPADSAEGGGRVLSLRVGGTLPPNRRSKQETGGGRGRGRGQRGQGGQGGGG